MHRHRRRNIRNRLYRHSLYIHSLRSLRCRDRDRQRHKDRHNRHTHSLRCRDRHSPHRRDRNRHTHSIRSNREYGRRNNSRHSRRQDRRYSRTRNTCSGQADSSLPNLNTRRSLKCRTGRKRGSCKRTNSSNRTSPTRSTPHTVRRTMRNTLISHSPCWNPSIHLIRQFKLWHSKLKE